MQDRDTGPTVLFFAVWEKIEMTRLRLRLTLVAALVVYTAFGVDARAQNYPNRAITIIVPFAPGGLTGDRKSVV